MRVRHFIFIILGLISGYAAGQGTMNPGDANNDGTVDHHDLLNVGFAYGNFGPARLFPGGFGTQSFLAPWAGIFPNGLNFAHADADGNGQVNLLDLIWVTTADGNEFPGGIPLDLPQGMAGQDATFLLNDGVELSSDGLGGQVVDVTVTAAQLGGGSGVNGLAFTLSWRPEFVVAAEFNLAPGWLLAGPGAFPMIRQEADRIRVALTRLGADPVFDPTAEVGTLSLTIIEDLVGLLPNAPGETIGIAYLDSLQLVDGDFELLPTVGDSLALTVPSSVSSSYQPETAPPAARLYPNPAKNNLTLECERPFERLTLYDASGRVVFRHRGLPTEARTLSLPSLPAGSYRLRVKGRDFSLVLPLNIVP